MHFMEKITIENLKEKIVSMVTSILLGKGVTDISTKPEDPVYRKNNLLFYTPKRPQGVILKIYKKKEEGKFHVTIEPNSCDIISSEITISNVESGCKRVAENIAEFFDSLIILN